jgi:protein-histidine pros-kinase
MWLFLEAVQQSPIATSITDPKARILYANPAFEKVTGYPVAEVTGQNQSILSYKTTPRAVYEALWASVQGKRTWNGTLVNRRKDGTRYIAEVTITPILNAEGETVYCLGMHRDVTALYALKQKVQNQKALIESVVDLAPIAMALMDEQGRVVLDNNEYKKLVSDLGMGEPAKALLAELTRTHAIDKTCIDGGVFMDAEVSLQPPQGKAQRWFACSGSWFKQEDTAADAFFDPKTSRYMMLLVKDITSQKRERELERMNAIRATMAEAELVQSLRETLAGAIYQLGAPLNMIRAASNMLERRGAQIDPEMLRRALKDALTAGETAIATFEGSMPAAPSEALAPVNLNEILRDVLILLTGRLLGAGITVDWVPDAHLGYILGRATMLRGMFKELIENAIEAMNERGRSARDLRIATTLNNGRIQVQIEDSGPGIPPAIRHKIFEPFFTTKRLLSHSVGMGLAIAQDVAMHHDGVLEIDSDSRNGCRVVASFPLSGA